MARNSTGRVSENDRKEYLRKLSQRVYNIREIVNVRTLIDPEKDLKELSMHYYYEADRLRKLLDEPVGSPLIPKGPFRLDTGLIFNTGETEKARKELEESLDWIRLILGKAEEQRRHYYNAENPPIQGLEKNSSLEKFLNGVRDRKNLPKAHKKMRDLHPTEIRSIHVLEDKTENKRITIFINKNYHNPKTYSRNKKWSGIYKLAKDQYVNYDKGILDYFNSNKNNPLYAREGFVPKKILKMEEGCIVPNVEIKPVTQKMVTTRLNAA